MVATLAAHSHDTLMLDPKWHFINMGEHSTGWQGRSRKLYRLTAEIAASLDP